MGPINVNAGVVGERVRRVRIKQGGVMMKISLK